MNRAIKEAVHRQVRSHIRVCGRGRVIDVTRAAAQELGFIGNGIARVKLTVVDGQGRLSGNCT